LVGRLDTGPWIRVSGVAGLEWHVLLGQDVAEAAAAEALTKLVKPGQTIIDVGANIGYFSLTAAVLVGDSGRVIAFEPHPVAAGRLRQNVALNDLSNVEIVEAAVAHTPGSLRLFLGEDSEGSSLYDLGLEPNLAVADVRALTLDDYVVAERIGKVDLLKIDAEGAEVNVLRGAQCLLSVPDAPAVIIEANPLTLQAAGESIDALRSKLQSLGYKISILERINWLGTTVENWLATKAG